MRINDLDSVIDVIDTEDAKARGMNYSRERPAPGPKKLIGVVERYFDKINVVAIKLSSGLRVGDTIEIGDEESSVRQKVASMQIDKEYEGAVMVCPHGNTSKRFAEALKVIGVKAYSLRKGVAGLKSQ